jgi:hypothetical protein
MLHEQMRLSFSGSHPNIQEICNPCEAYRSH